MRIDRNHRVFDYFRAYLEAAPPPAAKPQEPVRFEPPPRKVPEFRFEDGFESDKPQSRKVFVPNPQATSGLPASPGYWQDTFVA